MKRLSFSAATKGFAMVLTVLAAGGCAAKERVRPSVKIDGSSTVYPITRAAAEQFQRQEPVDVATAVPVGVSGTGGGFRKFCVGQTDISDASRPINRSEADLCAKNKVEYIEVPIAYDGLAVIVNPKNDWANAITTAELKRIWEPGAAQKVTRWSQVREGWPDRELHLYGAGVDSGTYDYFTDAIVGREHVSRMDFTSSEDDEVLVKDVSRDELALGFFGYAYVKEHPGELKAVGVDDGNAENGRGPIVPSPETVADGTYQPLSRPLFIYVSKEALARREVELFVGYFLLKCSKFVAKVGYVPFPEDTYRLAHERVIARRTGSLFEGGGSQVGLSIEWLLQHEQQGTMVQNVGVSQ